VGIRWGRSDIPAGVVAEVQACLRRRILRTFVGRGLLESYQAKEILAKQHSEPPSDKRSTRADELRLTPLELIDRIAALVPPARTHRHRYFGVLASNSPLHVPSPTKTTFLRFVAVCTFSVHAVIGTRPVHPQCNRHSQRRSAPGAWVAILEPHSGNTARDLLRSMPKASRQ
jgi:Putative transposase